jgi:hypothetical protein
MWLVPVVALLGAGSCVHTGQHFLYAVNIRRCAVVVRAIGGTHSRHAAVCLLLRHDLFGSSFVAAVMAAASTGST